MSLFRAIRSGSLKEVKRLLAKNANVNETLRGTTALALAVGRNDIKMAKLLLKHGADIDTRCEMFGNATVLHYAACVEFEDMVRLLLSKGADVNVRADDGLNALHASVFNGNEALFTMFIDAGLSIEGFTYRGMTIMSLAIDGNRPHMVQLLLDRGFGVETPDRMGMTPLCYAAGLGRAEIIQLLLDNKANIDFQQPLNGYTALLAASDHSNFEAVQILLANGARQDLVSKSGFTAFELAQRRKNKPLLEILTPFYGRNHIASEINADSIAEAEAMYMDYSEGVLKDLFCTIERIRIEALAGIVPDPMLALKQSLFPGQSKVCMQCGTTDSIVLKKCKGCLTAYYCSLACMKQNWPVHRAPCRVLALNRQKQTETSSKGGVNINDIGAGNEEQLD